MNRVFLKMNVVTNTNTPGDENFRLFFISKTWFLSMYDEYIIF